ncbi:MAG: RHS repeat-associated core domain-containing protein, partial [Opitutales bacterium]|nr:RHS repeat-associated core domain-containing protein [Opitutales bacterium]
AHYDYAPFGATTRTHRDSTASFDIVSLNPFRFSSEYYDSELDLVYYNYRHYSPGLGRFLSRDPIAEQGGLNLYAFVENNTNSYDVLGRQCCVIIVHPGTYEDVRDPSMFGHAILDCGENAYLSFFPEGKKEDKVGIGAKPGKNHTKEEDEKRYGKFDFGSRNEIIHPNGGRITRQCLPDCVDDASIVSIIKTLVSTTPNWDFNDSNCADMVMTALDRAMNQEKPKCGKCEVVVDILKKHSEIRTPDGVRDDIVLLTKNNCTRYLCSFDPVQAAKALTQSVVNGISYFFK